MIHHLCLTESSGAAETPRLVVGRGDVSPVWSVYDEGWGSDGGHIPAGESPVMGGEEEEGAPRRVPPISQPAYFMTLIGARLKKEAPIGRGGQGAIYLARDESASAPDLHGDERQLSPPPRCSDSDDVAQSREGESAPVRRGRPVAVKRIFIQASDFGSLGMAPTTLREATLHRVVSDKQEQYLKAAGDSCAAEPDVEAVVDRRGPAPPRLLDESARLVRLHRIVEAPHKELCLVMELAVTNLERVALPYGRRGPPKDDGAGGVKRRPGTVSLFSATAAVAAGSDGGRSQPAVVAPRMPAVAASTAAADAARVPRDDSSLARLPLVRYLMRRLLRLVSFLHEMCGVVHRDLKLSNVLVTQDGGLRLGDFGSARFLPPPSPPTAAAGHTDTTTPLAVRCEGHPCTPPSMRTTLHYRSPEVLLGDQTCRAAADVWSLGVVFAQLVLQKSLFSAESELDLLGAIQKLLGLATHSAPASWPSEATAAPCDRPRNGDPLATAPPAPQASLPYKFHAGVLTADGVDLLSRMLQQRPEERITIRGAMGHPFLARDTTSAAAADEDDERGRVMWMESVAAVVLPASSAGRAGGSTTAADVQRRPVFAGLGDSDDEDEEGEEDEGGASPFRVDLGGYSSSS
ncbi:protein kinase [Novymonas esmeraldas]|uniref:Protein kinase n=1 Tax=Novymonas esmeraldas TaxID=1808958 RepID=A0AAW0F764_9TRYP